MNSSCMMLGLNLSFQLNCRPGSVIATFHIETTETSNPVDFVKNTLKNDINGNNNTFGTFTVNSNLLSAGEFQFGK